MGIGVACLVWPKPSLYVVAILIGWALLLSGIFDIIGSLMSRQMPYWWLYLIRGAISIMLGIWAIRHPGNALIVLVSVIGIWCILYGVIEVIGAFVARHAVRNWEELKQQVGT
jgi:uncharacterized membrane protein HdeD (DUF308 family)